MSINATQSHSGEHLVHGQIVVSEAAGLAGRAHRQRDQKLDVVKPSSVEC